MEPDNHNVFPFTDTSPLMSTSMLPSCELHVFFDHTFRAEDFDMTMPCLIRNPQRPEFSSEDGPKSSLIQAITKGNMWSVVYVSQS